ncbi:MAG: transposase [Ignavibacteria bacterium GWF2_33_9]|nr:MAG: transposase [Ignavibacteria bacterium GWF2_33_9]
MGQEQKVQKEKRTQKDYSLAFKLQVVNEVEKRFVTYKEAQRKYGIQGRSTVLVWLRKHVVLNWWGDSTMGKKMTPYKEIKELKKRIERLEAEKEVLNIAIDTADEMFGIEIRKKYLALSLEMQKLQSQNQEED